MVYDLTQGYAQQKFATRLPTAWSLSHRYNPFSLLMWHVGIPMPYYIHVLCSSATTTTSHLYGKGKRSSTAQPLSKQTHAFPSAHSTAHARLKLVVIQFDSSFLPSAPFALNTLFFLLTSKMPSYIPIPNFWVEHSAAAIILSAVCMFSCCFRRHGITYLSLSGRCIRNLSSALPLVSPSSFKISRPKTCSCF